MPNFLGSFAIFVGADKDRFSYIIISMRQINMWGSNGPGIGVGVMGLVEPKSGILHFSLHHNWKDLPIKSILEEEFKLPVIVDNDSRAMVLGEYWFGAGRGVRNLVLSC